MRHPATTDSRRAISSSSDAAAGADHAGQAQNGSEVRFGLHAELRPQIRDGSQIGRRDLLIDGDGGRAREFIAQRDVEMAAPDALADDLPDARLERLEALGHAQMQIEKTVIDAAHGDAQADAVLDGLAPERNPSWT